MGLPSKSTAPVRAQKGDTEPGHREISRWGDDQDIGADGRAGKHGWLLPFARTGPRSARRAWIDQGPSRRSHAGRPRLWCGLVVVISVRARIMPVIPPRKNRKHPAGYDKEMYKWRHLVENFFQKVKDYRGIATRYCKTDSSFTAFISLVGTVLWPKWTSTDPGSLSIYRQSVYRIRPEVEAA